MRMGLAPAAADAVNALMPRPVPSIREESESRIGSARLTPAARRKKRRCRSGGFTDMTQYTIAPMSRIPALFGDHARRTFLKMLSSSGALAAQTPAPGLAPNILIVMADQHRAGLTHRSGFPLDTMPALDRLAA